MRTHTCISMDITPKSNNYVCISLTFIGESPIGSWNVLKAQTESFVLETTIEQNLSPWKPPCYFNFFFSFSFFITNDLRNLNLIFLFSVAGIPLSASILTTGIVCTFYTSLVSNPNHMKMIYIRLSKPKTVLFNPLQLTINMHILHTVLYTFPKELTRRICLRIKSF